MQFLKCKLVMTVLDFPGKNPRKPLNWSKFNHNCTHSLFWPCGLFRVAWFWLPFSSKGRSGISSCWSNCPPTPLCCKMLFVMLFSPSVSRSLCANIRLLLPLPYSSFSKKSPDSATVVEAMLCTAEVAKFIVLLFAMLLLLLLFADFSMRFRANGFCRRIEDQTDPNSVWLRYKSRKYRQLEKNSILEAKRCLTPDFF